MAMVDRANYAGIVIALALVAPSAGAADDRCRFAYTFVDAAELESNCPVYHLTTEGERFKRSMQEQANAGDINCIFDAWNSLSERVRDSSWCSLIASRLNAVGPMVERRPQD
jgi:hypothetical protein